MFCGVFYVIIFPICLKPAPREGNPLLVVEEPPIDLFEELSALFPFGATGGILSDGCWLYFLVISGRFSLNSLSKDEVCILVKL
jgi:hypothetical protein